MGQRESFLNKKYPDLHRSQEVIDTHRRAKGKRGENPNADIAFESNSEGRIQDYLDYIAESIDEGNPERQVKLARFKNVLYKKYCITSADDIPESYWKSIQENQRKQGRAVSEITDQLKAELAKPIIDDQKESLDYWINYLASPDARYPDYLKYWVIRSVLKMGRYDREKKKFTKRNSVSVSPFPDVNQGALSFVIDAMIKKHAEESMEFGADITEEVKTHFLENLERENFANLYAIAIEEFKPISEELLKITQGAWRTFPKGSDPSDLVSSIKDYGTGWCIRGESTARRYLDEHTLEIYFSNDLEGNPTVPRLLLAYSQDGSVFEFRGIAQRQQHDDHISPVVAEKINELGEKGEQYKKRQSDVNRLDTIYEKTKEGKSLTRDELVFLYELDAEIEGFGFGRPDRVKELRKQRNLQEDMSIIFDCKEEDIAHSKEGIRQTTKAYVGELFPNIFQLLPDSVEYIYTSFPEGRARRSRLEIGGLTKEQLEQRMANENIHVSPKAKGMLNNAGLHASDSTMIINLVHLNERAMGFQDYPAKKEIYEKANELGLALCPSEVGPYYRLSNLDQPMNEWVHIVTNGIPDANGTLNDFCVEHNGAGLVLDDYLTRPDLRSAENGYYVFCLINSSNT